MTFKPLLAGQFDAAKQRYPAMVSPKLDGIRVLAMDGKPMSRAMKVLPNRHLQEWFSRNANMVQGMDGEIIVGDPTHPDVYRNTSSNVMSEDKIFDITFFVFDYWNSSDRFASRIAALEQIVRPLNDTGLQFVENSLVRNQDELDEIEAKYLGAGYEGVMVRDPLGLYKQGRSSTKEGILLKVKRYADAEAEIIGFEEEMHNTNEAFKSELGRTKRSSAQDGLIGKGTMGALIVRGINGMFKEVEFNIGTGFNAADRAEFWNNRDDYMGNIVVYKFFEVGVKDRPRHPVYKGLRTKIDL